MAEEQAQQINDTGKEDQSKESESDKRDDDKILEEARERFAKIEEDDRDNRDEQRSCFEFVYVKGKQWSDTVRSRRTSWDEPCLEFDQLKQFVNQVVNDERQNKPAILVHPAGGGASQEIADIEQGLIRAIEYDSNAEAAYDNGFQSAVVGGRGWWRVCTEYVQDAKKPTFNQRIIIKPIMDSMTVYADLDYEQPDASDRRFAFVVEKIPKTEFEKRWKKADAISFDAMDTNWKEGKDVILVADYYRRICTIRNLVAMSDGAVGYEDEMPNPPEGVTKLREREVETYSVEWYKIAGGNQILEEYDCPGDIIPIIQTTGDDIIIDGKRTYQGLVCKARDAQAMLNYGMTQQAIHLALTPKAPWVAPQEAIEDYQNIWKDANVKNYSVLPYKHKDRDGAPIPPPSRTQPSMIDSGWAQWTGTMTQMMRSTIGMYENSLGMKGNEVSGKAILAREKQGDVGTFHYVDNQHRAIALTGRIIQSWIPVYYDTEQMVHIIGKDGVRKIVTINQKSVQPTGNEFDPFKTIIQNDVTNGDYKVSIEAGPGFATKREETAEKLMGLVNSFPQLMQVAGDVVMKSLDVQDADIIAERFKFALPPQIQQALAAEQQGQKVDPVMAQKMQQAQQQMQQMQQAMQQMQQENQQLKSGAQIDMAKVQAKQQADTADLELRRKIAADEIQLQRDKAIEELQLKRDIAAQSADDEIEKARIMARAKIEVAEIEQHAKLQLDQINAANASVSESSESSIAEPAALPAPASPQQIHLHMGGGTKVITLPDGRKAIVQTQLENPEQPDMGSAA